MTNSNPNPDKKAEKPKDAPQPGWHPDTRRIDHGKKAAQ